MKEKLPYVKWFFSDWIRDTRGLSLEARGAWMDILSLMHDGDPYGHLAVAGKEIPLDTLARVIGTNTKVLHRLLEEMESIGIFSRTKEGIIFSRRLVKENYLRKVRGEGGKKGGNPILKDVGNVVNKVNLPSTLKDNLISDDKVNLRDNLPVQNKDNLKVNLRDNLIQEFQVNLPLARAMEVFQSPESRKKKKEKSPTPDPFILPDDIPADLWNDWMTIRKKKRATNTPRAMNLLICTLREITSSDPEWTIPRLIEQAIKRSWIGIEKDWLPSIGKDSDPPGYKNGKPDPFHPRWHSV